MKFLASKWVPSDAIGSEGAIDSSAAAGVGLVIILLLTVAMSSLGAIAAFLLDGRLVVVLLSWWLCGLFGVLTGSALSYLHSSRPEGVRDAAGHS